MNITNLIIGILIIVVTSIYLIYTLRSVLRDKEYNHITYSFDVKIVVGTIIILIAGIILAYRELSKLQLMKILFILSPFMIYSQSYDANCYNLSEGVFESYENGKKAGVIYRKGNFQLEDYLDGNDYTIVKFASNNCLYYMNSYMIAEDLDTITWAVTYKKISTNHYSFMGKPKYLETNYSHEGEIKKISNVIKADILKVFEQLESESRNAPR